MFTCNVCVNKSFQSQKALNKHDRKVHNVFIEKCYVCNVGTCSETFKNAKALLNHCKVHKDTNNSNKEYICNHCSKCFASKKTLCKHVKQCAAGDATATSTKHEVTKHQRLVCPVLECDERYNNYTNLRTHLSEYHNILSEEEIHEFNSNTEFHQWKSNVEQSLKASYVMDTAAKKLKSGAVRTYYICHHSYSSRLKGYDYKRNIKSSGTNKMERTCPSTLIVTQDGVNQKTLVQFFPLHVGHSSELGRLPIDKEERHKIAGKLSQGVTVDRILRDIREDDLSTGDLKRIHLIERKDINNVARDFSIGFGTKRHQNDAVSVKLWVESMKNLEENPILYYKEQGYEHPILDKNDFLLIIMTDFQATCFSLFGKQKVCIDGTHGLNAYDFQLFTVVVVDEYGSGIPVAFCFSNRQDVALFQIYFQHLKTKVGLITTNVFMSDDYPAFYAAWESVMTEAKHRLLCTWHVNHNWVKNANKIRNPEKKSLVLKTLKVIQKELDEDLFENQVQTFYQQLLSDTDTFAFSQYFLRTYMNRCQMWAYCYRKYTGINTNMYLESLHKTLKHFYLQGKKCKRLDHTINALINLIRDKMFERIIKIQKNKVSEKNIKIRTSHRAGELIPNDFMKKQENNTFLVISQSDNSHCFFVEKIDVPCEDFCALRCAKCKICIHSFKCSCPDNVINCNICKHIHACCIKYFLTDNNLDNSNTNISSFDINKSISIINSNSNTCNKKNTNLIDAKLAVISGLNSKLDVSDNATIQISKYLDKVIDIYNNSSNQFGFESKEGVNIKQKIEPQVRFFSNKNKRKHSNSPQMLPFETKVIKLALANPQSYVPNVQTGFDHNYSEMY